MRTVFVLTIAALLAGCATNPLKDARYWKIDQCAGASNPTVRFQSRDGTSTLATIPRESCAAVSRAVSKIERAANLYTDRVQIADILDSNAFANRDTNGRPVVTVTLGMLKALGSDEAAWAGLVGHEIAHLLRNHSAGREDAKTGAAVAGQAVASAIGLFVPGVGGAIASTVGGTAAQMALYGAFTRPQEREADELGLQWMVAAGYDPRGVERLFEVLRKEGGVLPGFLSTHPGAEDRAERVRDYIGKTPQSSPDGNR